MIYQAKEFEQKIYDLINNSNLPVDTAYYVLKSVMNEFELQLIQYMAQEHNNETTEEQVYDVYPEGLHFSNIDNNEKKEQEDE